MVIPYDENDRRKAGKIGKLQIRQTKESICVNT